jgi:hypothetical protein
LFLSGPFGLLLIFVCGQIGKAVSHCSAQLDESRRLAALTALPQVRVAHVEHLGGDLRIH